MRTKCTACLVLTILISYFLVAVSSLYEVKFNKLGVYRFPCAFSLHPNSRVLAFDCVKREADFVAVGMPHDCVAVFFGLEGIAVESQCGSYVGTIGLFDEDGGYVDGVGFEFLDSVGGEEGEEEGEG